MFRPAAVLTLVLALTPVAAADPPVVSPTPPTVTAEERRQLAELLRGMLAQNMPEPLAHTEKRWGQQREVLVGLKWHRLKPETQKAVRNDGHWQRLDVTVVDPARSLSLDVRNVASPEPGRSTFEALVGLDVRAEHESQVWKSGARLAATTTRARCRTNLTLACEVTSRTEHHPGHLLPAAVVRVRVTAATLSYTDFVCERIAGMDGRAAKLTGDALRGFVRQIKPTLETDLLGKANLAIIKAADTHEVRVELDKLLAGQVPVTRVK